MVFKAGKDVAHRRLAIEREKERCGKRVAQRKTRVHERAGRRSVDSARIRASLLTESDTLPVTYVYLYTGRVQEWKGHAKNVDGQKEERGTEVG